jgi:hypothetical protein
VRWLGWSVVLCAVRVGVPFVPLRVNGAAMSVGRAHAVCGSALGQIGQALSATAASDCGSLGLLYDGLNVLAVAAVVCACLFVRAMAAEAGR